MMMQTGLPSGLQTALQAQMEREVMSGQARTMTREETPTVFGKLMAEVAPPAVPDVAQQAGLAGQIQAMRMQQAQEALMNQAMAQRPPAGIEGLNPQMGGYADGGIVGYAVGGRPELDRSKVDVAQQEEREAIAGLETEPPTPEQEVQRALAGREARRGYMQQIGLDPDYIDKQIREAQTLKDEELGILSGRRAALEEKKKGRGLKEYFLGASGRGFGDVMASAERGGMRFDDYIQAQEQAIENALIGAKSAGIKEQRLLMQAKVATDMGDFTKAQAFLAEAQKMRNAKADLEAKAARGRAKEEADLATALFQGRVNMRGQDVREALGDNRGDTRADSAAMQRMKADGRYKSISESLARATQMRQGLKPDAKPDRVAEVNRRYDQAAQAYADLAKQYGVKIGEMPSADQSGGGKKTLNWGDI
jgi:hypothetical protein